MQIYIIERPHLDTKFNKLLNKKLEVYECNYDMISYGETIPLYVHEYFKNGWVIKKYVGESIIISSEVYESFDDNYHRINHYDPRDDIIIFSTLQDAKIAKLMILKEISEKLESYIKDDEIKEIVNHKEYLLIPNIEKPLKELKGDYPEYFI